MIRKTLSSLVALVVALGLVALISAQEKKTTLTGYVTDKACSAGQAKKDDPMAAAANHPVKCALMEKCAASGYGVFADGKFYEFDQKGNELAKTLLQNTQKPKGIKVSVEGKLHESHLMVDKISEVE